MRLLVIVLLGLMGFAGIGCHAKVYDDIWSSHYRQNPAIPAAADLGKWEARRRPDPQIRMCTPDQVREAAAIEQKYLDDRKMAREDETLEDQHQIQALQFPILRLRDPVGSVVLLGDCDFAAHEQLEATDEDFTDLAKRKQTSFIVLCFFPRQETSDYNLRFGRTVWGGGAAWGPQGSYGVSAQFYRRLTPEERKP